jgi:hypothetical protein
MTNKLNNWQSKISELSGSKTFCILPWIHFATRPNGDMRLCCGSNASGAGTNPTIGLVKNESGTPANFGKETPLSAWNNTYMKDVRTTMLEGNIPKSCSKCFIEEDNGVSSKRLWETMFWINDGMNIPELVENTNEGVIPEKLRYLDLRLGHTCNLKCVMCSPNDSSKWVADYKKIIPITKNEEIKKQISWDEDTFNNTWYENPVFWKEITDQIPNLRQVYFAGGEPLMIKEHTKFIDTMIESGYSSQIQLRYNSNGILISEDVIKKWEKFRSVRFGFSLDAAGDRNNYIRYPTEWATVEKNLHRLDNTPDNISVSIACAVQVLNIKHIPEFIKWKVGQKFKKINNEVLEDGNKIGGGLINMHLLYMPTFLSLRMLPEKDKNEVTEKFMELKSWLYDNYTKDSYFWNENPYGWFRYQALLDFMHSKDQSSSLPAFREYINNLDSIRKTSFSTVFPELSHLVVDTI